VVRKKKEMTHLTWEKTMRMRKKKMGIKMASLLTILTEMKIPITRMGLPMVPH